MFESEAERQVILDTETTGLVPEQGHRIIEVGCVEMVDRRLTGNNFHQYIQPDRQIDAGAIEVHGITNESLADKPRFADITTDLMDYLQGAELVIHNAPFDVGFLNAELARISGWQTLDQYCTVLDTLQMAREMHPGQRNSLDALCGRYDINNTHREKHGALLDAEILADVYLAMTGGQTALMLDPDHDPDNVVSNGGIRRLSADRRSLPIVDPDAKEIMAHQLMLEAIATSSDGCCVWLK